MLGGRGSFRERLGQSVGNGLEGLLAGITRGDKMRKIVSVPQLGGARREGADIDSELNHRDRTIGHRKVAQVFELIVDGRLGWTGVKGRRSDETESQQKDMAPTTHEGSAFQICIILAEVHQNRSGPAPIV
jgi:hypothetical protein